MGWRRNDMCQATVGTFISRTPISACYSEGLSTTAIMAAMLVDVLLFHFEPGCFSHVACGGHASLGQPWPSSDAIKASYLRHRLETLIGSVVMCEVSAVIFLCTSESDLGKVR
mmetsp:Transcript_10570/g.23806  ORF Transcript_10570/g.23806 Transcript_10570/m.23806 type:complete len:113 (+) Transcript_10570:34-372(+)